MKDLDDNWDDDDISHVHRIGNNVSKGSRHIRVICREVFQKRCTLEGEKFKESLLTYSRTVYTSISIPILLSFSVRKTSGFELN